jgi:8-oxo-dGTP pyrophosphatase MutT (NUDIX family)
LRQRLAGPLPGLEAQMRMAPRPRTWPEPGDDHAVLRPAAALLLLYPHREAWHVPLTVRSAALRSHTGQISLPGGRVDVGESFEAAALREAHEEIGVAPGDVEVLGDLTPVHIWVSRHLLHPVVGVTRARPEFRLHAPEVDRLIELPVAALVAPQAVQWEQRARTRPPLGVMDVPYFDLDGARCWGATAMVLAEFAALVGERGQD